MSFTSYVDDLSIQLNYENMPMQLTKVFKLVKMKIFSRYFFYIFAQNIDCGNTLEPHRRGGSNQYPQSMFWSKKGFRGGILFMDMFS